MRYESELGLRADAQTVGNGRTLVQSQEGLNDQLADLLVLANRFGLYDAADWLQGQKDHRTRYHLDYGEEPS